MVEKTPALKVGFDEVVAKIGNGKACQLFINVAPMANLQALALWEMLTLAYEGIGFTQKTLKTLIWWHIDKISATEDNEQRLEACQLLLSGIVRIETFTEHKTCLTEAKELAVKLFKSTYVVLFEAEPIAAICNLLKLNRVDFASIYTDLAAVCPYEIIATED